MVTGFGGRGSEAARSVAEWQWWFLAAAVPLVFCASRLDLDLWYDEAYTLLIFVSRPWVSIATDYSAPNNHILYSLILRPFYLVSDSEFVLRLPSFLFTLGALYGTFRLVRPWAGRPAAAMATLQLGLTQMFLAHTMQLRGYGLSMCLAVWLAVLALPVGPAAGAAGRGAPAKGKRRVGRAGSAADWAAAHRRPWLAALTALFGAAFLYVMPTNVLFFVPLAAAACGLAGVWARSLQRGLVAAVPWCAATLLAGLLYLPVLDQLLEVGGQARGISLNHVVELTAAVFWAALRDWLPAVGLALVGLALLLLDRREADRRLFVFAGLLLVLTLGPFLVTLLLGIRPFVRNYCPLLPFLGAWVGLGLAHLFRILGQRLRRRWSEPAQAVAGAALLAAVAMPMVLTYPARLTAYRRAHEAQDGYYNYYAANYQPSQVVAYLRGHIDPERPYRIVFARRDYFPLWFYLQREGVPPGRGPRGPETAIYLITPPRPDYRALSEASGLSPEQLQALPLIRDFGYYRLYGGVLSLVSRTM